MAVSWADEPDDTSEEMTSPYWRLDTSSGDRLGWRAQLLPAAGGDPADAGRTSGRRPRGRTLAIAALHLACPGWRRASGCSPPPACSTAARGRPDRGAGRRGDPRRPRWSPGLTGRASWSGRRRPWPRPGAARRTAAAEAGWSRPGWRVELAAFDDPRFYDRLHRARDRGVFYLERSVDDLVELVAAALTVAAAAAGLAARHPVLLPVLLVGVLPEAVAVLHAAGLGHAGTTRTVTLDRRVQMLTELATEREPAAEVRATQAERFLRDEFGAVADALRDQEVAVGLAQARVRAVGRAASGLALLLPSRCSACCWARAGSRRGGRHRGHRDAVRLRCADPTRPGGQPVVEQGLYVGDYSNTTSPGAPSDAESMSFAYR